MSNRRRHDGNRENPDKSKCLGVFGLSLYTTERELEKEFGKFGPLERVQVDMDGRKIRVDFSITKRAHTPTPGMYMGRPTSSR